jgi:LPS-assembly protein
VAVVPVEGRKRLIMARLAGAMALACLSAVGGASAVFAQDLSVMAPEVPTDSQMLLEADTLVYDNDEQTVTAVGGVQIDYGGNRLVAERVTYNRKTGRLLAIGNVEIVDSSAPR